MQSSHQDYFSQDSSYLKTTNCQFNQYFLQICCNSNLTTQEKPLIKELWSTVRELSFAAKLHELGRGEVRTIVLRSEREWERNAHWDEVREPKKCSFNI